MAEFSIGQVARRGFGGLFDVRGRDNRLQYWIFAALVFGPLMALQFVTQLVLMFGSIDFAHAPSPDNVEATRRLFEQQARAMVTQSYVYLAVYLIGAILLVSATARRLHDRGHGGWRAAILPLGFFATGLAQAHRTAEAVKRMPALMTEMQAKKAMDPSEMLRWMAEANAPDTGPDWLAVIGGLILLWLIVELLRAGTDHPNRFGPVPG